MSLRDNSTEYWRLRYRVEQKAMGMRYKLLRGLVRLRQWWFSNSGDWRWLNEKPVPLKGLNRSLWKGSVPSTNFFVLLTLSGIISTLGLLANSAPTIIGAMIVAPLVGPIIGIAYSVSIGNRRLLRRAFLTLAFGLTSTVAGAVVISLLIPLQTFGSEITSRTQPTLIDLAIAIAAGAAGAFTKSRRGIADALPGVAIAVALVPPLSIMGIGVAAGSVRLTGGATLLFATNLAGIIFGGSLIFLWQRYGSVERAKHGLAFGTVSLLVLTVPLGLSFRSLLIETNARQRVALAVREQLADIPNADIQQLNVQQRRRSLVIQLELVAPDNSISAAQIRQLSNILADELDQPINLKIRLFPIQTYESQSN